VTVAELLIDGLRQAGAQRLFTGPHAGFAPDLLEAATAHGLPVVRVSSDAAACVMAAVTAEVTGAPGAALAASGSDALAGLAYARDNRAPVVLLTEPSVDPAAATGLVRERLRVTADSAARWIAHAVRLALKEPRGPVEIEVPRGVASAPALAVALNLRPIAGPPPDPAMLDAAAELIAGASRPLVIAGLGCGAEDTGWLRAFVEAMPAPALATVTAKGAVPEAHPLALGVFTGDGPEDAIVRRADLLIAVGLDAVELAPGSWRFSAPVVHVSRAPASGEAYRPAVEVIGDPGLVMEELAPLLRGKARADWDVAEVDRLKREQERRIAEGEGAARGCVVRIARELTPAGTIAAIDGGAGMWPVARAWQAVARGECLAPVRLATAGVALPAAIAAQLAWPERRVLSFADAEGLGRAAAELPTAVRLGLPIVIIAFGDVTPELGALGGSLVCHRATDAETARRAIVQALEADRPALVLAGA
jgi:acetolactate synthase-1/2/3 large subunit